MGTAKSGNMGVLIVSHGKLSQYFLEAARLIYQDELEGIQALPVSSKSDRRKVMEDFHSSVAKFEEGTDRILVLCDTHGATPSRLICDCEYEDIDVRCVFGLNLSMLLDCVNYMKEGVDIAELSDRICKTGKEAIYSKQAGSNGSQKTI